MLHPSIFRNGRSSRPATASLPFCLVNDILHRPLRCRILQAVTITALQTLFFSHTVGSLSAPVFHKLFLLPKRILLITLFPRLSGVPHPVELTTTSDYGERRSPASVYHRFGGYHIMFLHCLSLLMSPVYRDNHRSNRWFKKLF